MGEGLHGSWHDRERRHPVPVSRNTQGNNATRPGSAVAELRFFDFHAEHAGYMSGGLIASLRYFTRIPPIMTPDHMSGITNTVQPNERIFLKICAKRSIMPLDRRRVIL